jgi:hypothetical protein
VKTISLKKVSAVAVASLAFGAFTPIAPARAAVANTGLAVDALTMTTATASVAVGATASSTFGVSFGAAGDGTKVGAVLVSLTKPVGSSVTVADKSGATGGIVGSTTGSVAANVTLATATGVNNAGAGDQFTFTPTTAALAADTNLAGTVTLVPDVAGIYILTLTGTTAASPGVANAVTATFTVTAGYDAGGTVNTGRALASEGSNVSTGWAGTSGGKATVRIFGLASSTRYYVTVDKGAILDTTEGDTGTNIPTMTLTNGTNLSGGVNFTTGTMPAAKTDWLGISVTDLGNTSTTVTVSTYAAGTGAATTFVAATVTWGVSAAPSAQYSTLGLNAGTGTAITAAASDTTATTVVNTTNTQQFNIMVSVRDQYDVAYNGFVLSASMTGPGSLGLDSDQDGSAPSTGRSIKATLADNAGQISIYGDGTSGKTVVTIVATTTAGVSVTLGTKTVTFAGSASKATVTQNLFVAKAGAQLGVTPATTKVTEAGVSTTPALTAVVTDSSGTAVASSPTVKIESSDSTVIVPGTCVALSVDADPATAGAQAAPGTFECSVSGAVGAASGKSATITFSALNTSTGLYSIVATPIKFTIGGAIAKSVISLDKASYTAGEAVTLLATSTDSSGNAAYDGQTPYTSISSNKGFGGSLPATTKEIVSGKTSTTSSKGVASLFAPSTPGSFTITGLYTDEATGTAYSTTGSVVDGNAALVTQIDALNAKIVALNALIAKIMKKLGVK